MTPHTNAKLGTVRTILQSLSRPKERLANKERMAPEVNEAEQGLSEATEERKEVRSTYANTAVFWAAYEGLQPGKERRKAILGQMVGRRLPVNCKWQASTQDLDLRYLLKKGVLKQVRQGGSTSRQTYLVLS